jgi:hypothetical protein
MPPVIFSGTRGSRAIISFGGYQSGHSCLRLMTSVPVQEKPSRPTEIGYW